MATIDTVRSILEKNLDIAPEKVSEDSTFESLGIDSLDMVELVCDIEDECDIEFGEPGGLGSIADLVAYIDSLK